MSVLHKFGQTTIAKVRNSIELTQVLVDPWLESETIILKPNWVTTEPGGYTEAETLRMMFDTLDSKIVVIESYHIGRSMNLLEKGMSFTIGDRKVDWSWLLKDEGWNWLIENSNWDWFKDGGHWDQIKREDQAFLDENGFTDLFKEYNVNYINITEEVWKRRVADPVQIQNAVESRFRPVERDKLYTMMPRKLYDLRGSPLISLARLKQYASFTLKNMFGLITDPMRSWWHGPQNSKIATNIIDINKIYHSLFDVYGICEALNTTAIPDPKGKFEGFMGRYNLKKDVNIVVFGRDLVSVDALMLTLTKRWIEIDERSNRKPIELAEKEGLGSYSLEALNEATMKVGNWLKS